VSHFDSVPPAQPAGTDTHCGFVLHSTHTVRFVAAERAVQMKRIFDDFGRVALTNSSGIVDLCFGVETTTRVITLFLKRARVLVGHPCLTRTRRTRSFTGRPNNRPS
jgi:hypothetical protein